MMSEGKVSIVVPVFNCEEYLDQCITSILKQSYERIELLLIDDGAIDRSGRICDSYASDARVRVYHRNHAGVSRTRNYGVAKATGQYVMFVDGDDSIERDMVEVLVGAIRTQEADCAFCGLVHEYPSQSRNFPEQPVQKVTDGIGAIREVLMNYIAIAGPVCKLFDRKLLEAAVEADKPVEGEEERGIFPADLTIGEDAVAMVAALKGAKKVAFDTRPLYHYYHRKISLMSCEYSERDMDLIKAYQRIGESMTAHGLENETMFRQIWAHFRVYDKMIWSSSYDKQREGQIVSWLRRRFRTILRNPFVGKMRKLSMCALMVNKRLYRFIIWHRG